MRTNAPQLITWIIAVVIGSIGILSKLVVIPFLPVSPFGLIMIAFLLLAAATVLKGL